MLLAARTVVMYYTNPTFTYSKQLYILTKSPPKSKTPLEAPKKEKRSVSHPTSLGRHGIVACDRKWARVTGKWAGSVDSVIVEV